MEEAKQREEQQEVESPTPHVVIMLSPEKGHLIPLVKFAKRLVLVQRFTVTSCIRTLFFR
uniref:Uncharacterized protein n=1 Tax=Cucumis melo TaxID=3656 RepID=A0A9I9D926_CUCME